jgi:hypothetical protein
VPAPPPPPVPPSPPLTAALTPPPVPDEAKWRGHWIAKADNGCKWVADVTISGQTLSGRVWHDSHLDELSFKVDLVNGQVSTKLFFPIQSRFAYGTATRTLDGPFPRLVLHAAFNVADTCMSEIALTFEKAE